MCGWFFFGGVMFFLHFMLFPTFLETNKSGNKLFCRKTILFHSMCSSRFFMLYLFPTFFGNIEKCPFTYWLNGRWFLQMVDRDFFNIKLNGRWVSPDSRYGQWESIQNTEFISHMYIHVMHYNNNNNYRKIS